jgi:hypothetical protein
MSAWAKQSESLINRMSGGDQTLTDYRNADAEMIRGTIRGFGPDSLKPKPEAGVRVVFNLSAAHVPTLVAAGAASNTNRPYKNRYDIGQRKARLGEEAPATPSVRERVDAVIASFVGKQDGRNLYYGAAELNGAGMRYYGDICLVLKSDQIEANTLVLYRNSFDLARKPIRDRITVGPANSWHKKAIGEAKKLAGTWADDLAEMAVCKVLDGAVSRERLLTTGAISDGVLGDEDFLEVVRTRSFGWDNLEETRVSSADAGAEGRIADRLTRGPTPQQTELLWRHRRRVADQKLARKSVATRIIVTMGRARS